MDIFSTASVPRSTRASYWNDVYSRRFAQVTFSPVDRDGFEAELRMGAVGPIGMARVLSKPTNIERNKTHIEQSRGRRLFSFLLQTKGSGVFSHYGHQSVLEEGDFTLCDNAAPHRFDFSGRTEFIILRVAPEVLRSYLPYPEQVCGLRLPAAKGTTAAAATMAHSLWKLVEDGLPEKLSAMIARSVLDVMATSYAICFESKIDDSSAIGARKIQAKRYIEAHLKEPDLTPCTLALALRISPRYLRMLFAGDGETLSAYILRRRLEECARQMSNVLWRGHSITDIAFAGGFNSAAHFTRCFRDQYGMTPSHYRRMNLLDSPASVPSPERMLLA